MSEANASVPTLTSESFKAAFSRLQPMLLKEWPSVDRGALAATEGDLDRVVDVVAEKTQHTKALVRQKLDEIYQLSSRNGVGSIDHRLHEILDRIEKRTGELASELRAEMLPQAKEKVKENLLLSLLVAVGFGFILGILFGFGGRRDR